MWCDRLWLHIPSVGAFAIETTPPIIRPRKLSHGIDLYRHTRWSTGVDVVFDGYTQIAMFSRGCLIGNRFSKISGQSRPAYDIRQAQLSLPPSLSLWAQCSHFVWLCWNRLAWQSATDQFPRCSLFHLTIVSDPCAATRKPCHVRVLNVFRLHSEDRLRKSEPAPCQLMQNGSFQNFGNAQRSRRWGPGQSLASCFSDSQELSQSRFLLAWTCDLRSPRHKCNRSWGFWGHLELIAPCVPRWRIRIWATPFLLFQNKNLLSVLLAMAMSSAPQNQTGWWLVHDEDLATSRQCMVFDDRWKLDGNCSWIQACPWLEDRPREQSPPLAKTTCPCIGGLHVQTPVHKESWFLDADDMADGDHCASQNAQSHCNAVLDVDDSPESWQSCSTLWNSWGKAFRVPPGLLLTAWSAAEPLHHQRTWTPAHAPQKWKEREKQRESGRQKEKERESSQPRRIGHPWDMLTDPFQASSDAHLRNSAGTSAAAGASGKVASQAHASHSSAWKEVFFSHQEADPRERLDISSSWRVRWSKTFSGTINQALNLVDEKMECKRYLATLVAKMLLL